MEMSDLKHAKHLATFVNSALYHLNQLEPTGKNNDHSCSTIHPTLHSIILTAFDPSFMSNKGPLVKR
jgi:hypothetical protein